MGSLPGQRRALRSCTEATYRRSVEGPEGADDYEPERYWASRLSESYTLSGTGHAHYNEAYNAWLYRAKRRALRAALTELPPVASTRGRALDIGSGTGWVVTQLEQSGWTADGCDIAPLAVEQLAQSHPTAQFTRWSWGDGALEELDESRELVTALDVAYHVVDEDEFVAGVEELARVLTTDGHLIVTDGLGAESSHPAAHVRFRSRDRWLEVTVPAGLTLVTIRPVYGWLSRDRPTTPRLSRLPDGPRGALEYALDRLVPRSPHIRMATFRKH